MNIDFTKTNYLLEEKNTISKPKVNEHSFSDKDYIKSEFSKIKLSKDFKPQIKIMGEKSETRWLSITKEQFEKIQKFLEK